MNLRRTLTAAIGIVALGAATGGSALAAPSTPSTATPTTQASRAPTPSTQTAHSSLRLDVARGTAWVGQAVPVTVTAVFRSAEGVTLEGAPQLTSPGIFTSELAREPRQATEMLNGQSVLVATWSGTVTPSSPGPLAIAATLPVRVKYREAAPQQVQMPDLFQNDPFAGLGGNLFDTSMVQHLLEQSMGRVREESVSLRTSERAIDAQEPPTAGQPATFSGAVGRFGLQASVSSARVQVSEPITLRVVVEGVGDLDRVDLAGVATSDLWKAYPPKSTLEPAVPGKRPARKVFEQVLVPLRGGARRVPPVSLTSFDPASGRYVTQATSPLDVLIEGAAIAADVGSPSASVASAPAPSTTSPMEQVVPLPKVVNVSPWKVALRVMPVLLLVLAVGLTVRLRRRRAERTLRRSMRRAAGRGNAVPFYRAAHALIEARLSDRWGVRPEDVSTNAIRARLGDEGEPLAEVLAADEALRFGRAELAAPELVSLCSSIERSLGGVT